MTRQSGQNKASDLERSWSVAVISALQYCNRVVVIKCEDSPEYWTKRQAWSVVVESPTNGVLGHARAAVNEEGAA